MKPLDREILQLRAMDGMSYDTIAATLDIDALAATKRHTRALDRFREMFPSLNPRQ